jgi:hypothetical protein
MPFDGTAKTPAHKIKIIEFFGRDLGPSDKTFFIAGIKKLKFHKPLQALMEIVGKLLAFKSDKQLLFQKWV